MLLKLNRNTNGNRSNNKKIKCSKALIGYARFITLIRILGNDEFKGPTTFFLRRNQ